MTRAGALTAAWILMLSASAAHAAEARSVSADAELDRQVAVFMASNIKLSIDNGLKGISELGLPIDTTQIRQLIFEELSKPYDRTAHDAAEAAIDSASTALIVSHSAEMLRKAAEAPGALRLPDGTVIETLSEGTGVSPTATSTVSMRYTGYLPDGSEFDTVAPEEAPFTAQLSSLTPGLASAMPHMKAGGHYRVTIPPEQAYGSEGIPGIIPPDCALSFDLYLLDVK